MVFAINCKIFKVIILDIPSYYLYRELPSETIGERKVLEENRLPRTLLEAANRMRVSDEAKEMFGEEFVEHFTMTREWEYNEYLSSFQKKVTPWELKRYAEII